jgi:hypothetical protein
MTQPRALLLPALALVILGTPVSVRAQGAPVEPPLPARRLPIALSGEFGSSAESYTRQGRDALRPEQTGELYLRSTVTLFNRLSADLDLLLSTADGVQGSAGSGFGRQRLNRLGIAPTWSWGKAYLGSFTDSYSRYTFGGIRVNGVGVAINPGKLRMASLFGTTDQPVSGGATDGSYRRRIVGGRIGWGRGISDIGDGTFLDLSLIRAWDDPRSLAAATTLPDGAGGLPVNALAVTPQENVVLGANGALELIDGRLRFAGEASAAAHSRDRRAPELHESLVPGYPQFLRSLLTPRVSTHADYAYRLETTYRVRALPGGSPSRPRTMDLGAEFSQVGPGYVSLGVASLPADQRSLGLRGQVRFPAWTLGLNTRMQQDNLIGQKLATTERLQVGANLTVRPTRRWTASLRAMTLGIANGSSDTLRRIDYGSNSLNLGNTLSFTQTGALRSVSVNYGYRDAGDSDPTRSATTLESHTVDLRAAISPNRTFHFSPSIGLVRARSGAMDWSLRESYGVTTTARVMEGRWISTLALGSSRATPNRSARISLSSQFQVTESQVVSLGVSAQHFRDELQAGADAQEYMTYLRFTRRFP